MKKIILFALLLISPISFAKPTNKHKEYCDRKVELAEAAYEDFHDRNYSLDKMLDILKEQRNNMVSTGTKVPQFVYIEWQRLVRDIVRNEHYSLNTIRGRTRMSCMRQGF